MITAVAFDVFRLGIWLLLLAVVFVPLERLFALHPEKIWRRGMLADLGFYFLSSLIPGLVLSVPLTFVALAGHRIVPGAFQLSVEHLPFWIRVLAGLIVGEIGFYWGHRWSHEIPLLWRFHSVHHTPEHIDWLVNTRSHPVDMVFTRLCGLVPLYVLGLGGPGNSGGSLVPALVVIIGTVWGFFIHANIRWRLGAFEAVIATPAFHHWHHVQSGPINRNYAAMLPWLDRLFGTHHLPKGLWPEGYGIEPASPALDSLVGGQWPKSLGMPADDRNGKSRMPSAIRNATSSNAAHTP